MNLSSYINKRGRNQIDALISASIWDNAPIAIPTRPKWFIPAIASAAMLLIGAIAVPVVLPLAFNAQESNPSSLLPETTSQGHGGEASAFYLSTPERFSLQGVAYQSLLGDNLGGIDPDKDGQIPVAAKPYAAFVKDGYEKRFAIDNPGMPYLIRPVQSFNTYINFIYLYQIEGYAPEKALLIESSLYIAFEVELPEEITLSDKGYVSTHSLDLGALDPSKAGQTARLDRCYGAIVKRSYAERFARVQPSLPYFLLEDEKWNDVTNYVYIYSILEVDPSVALLVGYDDIYLAK